MGEFFRLKYVLGAGFSTVAAARLSRARCSLPADAGQELRFFLSTLRPLRLDCWRDCSCSAGVQGCCDWLVKGRRSAMWDADELCIASARKEGLFADAENCCLRPAKLATWFAQAEGWALSPKVLNAEGDKPVLDFRVWTVSSFSGYVQVRTDPELEPHDWLFVYGLRMGKTGSYRSRLPSQDEIYRGVRREFAKHLRERHSAAVGESTPDSQRNQPSKEQAS